MKYFFFSWNQNFSNSRFLYHALVELHGLIIKYLLFFFQRRMIVINTCKYINFVICLHACNDYYSLKVK